MRRIRVSLLVLLLALAAGAWAQAPAVNVNDPERKAAFELYDQHKMIEASAALAKIVAKYSKDVAAQEAYGVALLSRSDTQTDPAQRKADRLQARAELLKAKALGDNSDLCRVLLSMIPEDGSERDFSATPAVNQAMNRGEAAFAQGDWQGAIAEYKKALDMDPKLYLAAVDIGDCYFRMKDVEQASHWFGLAVSIDPNQEVAYRYWADALLQAGRVKDARAKYIEGPVANPYQSTSWGGLHTWLYRTHLQYRPIPKIPAGPTTDPQGKTTISVDTSQPDSVSAAWMAYSMERALWKQEKFAKEYPQERTYRHSLKEEVSALGMAADVYAETQQKKKDAHPDDGLALLLQYKQDGMLEAFVLLAHADQGIAQEYEAYRNAHRDKLLGFIDKYVLPPAP